MCLPYRFFFSDKVIITWSFKVAQFKPKYFLFQIKVAQFEAKCVAQIEPKYPRLEEGLSKPRETELGHFKDLLEMTTRCHKAEYLRKFISTLEEKGYGLDFHDDSIKKPLQLAKDKADWFDPLVEKEEELLKNINRNTLKLGSRFLMKIWSLFTL